MRAVKLAPLALGYLLARLGQQVGASPLDTAAVIVVALVAFATWADRRRR